MGKQIADAMASAIASAVAARIGGEHGHSLPLHYLAGLVIHLTLGSAR